MLTRGSVLQVMPAEGRKFTGGPPMADLLYLMGFFQEPTEELLQDLPLEDLRHLTVMPAFTVADRQLPRFQRHLRALTAWFTPFTLEGTKMTTLGREYFPVPALLVEAPSASFTLEDLHKSCSEALLEAGGAYLHPEFTGETYLPHVSHPRVGEVMEVSTLLLVHHSEGFGRGVKILSRFPLSRPCASSMSLYPGGEEE